MPIADHDDYYIRRRRRVRLGSRHADAAPGGLIHRCKYINTVLPKKADKPYALRFHRVQRQLAACDLQYSTPRRADAQRDRTYGTHGLHRRLGMPTCVQCPYCKLYDAGITLPCTIIGCTCRFLLDQRLHARQTDLHQHVESGRRHALYRLASEALRAGLALEGTACNLYAGQYIVNKCYVILQFLTAEGFEIWRYFSSVPLT